MNIEKVIHIMGGTLILGGLALSFLLSTWWIVLPVFIGLSLLIDGLTGFCMARIILKKLLK